MPKKKGQKNKNEHKQIGSGQPSKKDQSSMYQDDCLSRGPHTSRCICRGTGKIWVKRG